MKTYAIDKKILKESVQQLKVLYASHEKNLEKVKYNVPYKAALKSEMKKIKKLLKYYEEFVY